MIKNVQFMVQEILKGLFYMFQMLSKHLNSYFLKGKIGEIYNAVLKKRSVLEITQNLVKLIKNKNEIDDYIEFVEDRKYNDKRYYISFDKLSKLWLNKKFIWKKVYEKQLNIMKQ